MHNEVVQNHIYCFSFVFQFWSMLGSSLTEVLFSSLTFFEKFACMRSRSSSDVMPWKRGSRNDATVKNQLEVILWTVKGNQVKSSDSRMQMRLNFLTCRLSCWRLSSSCCWWAHPCHFRHRYPSPVRCNVHWSVNVPMASSSMPKW